MLLTENQDVSRIETNKTVLWLIINFDPPAILKHPNSLNNCAKALQMLLLDNGTQLGFRSKRTNIWTNSCIFLKLISNECQFWRKSKFKMVSKVKRLSKSPFGNSSGDKISNYKKNSIFVYCVLCDNFQKSLFKKFIEFSSKLSTTRVIEVNSICCRKLISAICARRHFGAPPPLLLWLWLLLELSELQEDFMTSQKNFQPLKNESKSPLAISLEA